MSMLNITAEVINNDFFSNVKKIRAAVQCFINCITATPETVIDRLCLRM